ncbi:MAG: alpha amylase C-terminal domain-containing protein, partial [Bacteroidota bacterium]
EKVDFAPDAYRMRFTSNHDENSWNGTEYERLGEGAQTFAVLSFMIPGMPLIYSGQESAMNKRLGFFDKDTISWEGYNLASFYSLLIRTKKENPALWNGEAGGNLKKIHSNNDNYIYAFSREKEGNKIIAIFNLSAASQPLKIEVKDLAGKYQNMITGDTETIGETITAMMNPWEYRIFIRK